jgi:uncharacterized protein with GYD domain
VVSEKLGGRVLTSFFAFGPFDVVGVMEMPDKVSAAEALDAVKKAGTCGYRSITAGASAAAARP